MLLNIIVKKANYWNHWTAKNSFLEPYLCLENATLQNAYLVDVNLCSDLASLQGRSCSITAVYKQAWKITAQ